MSWSIKLIGRKADVAALVKLQLVDSQNAPLIGATILDEINSIPDPSPAAWGSDSVIVEGYGHRGGCIGMLKVEPFCLAQSPSPAAPPVNNVHVEPGSAPFGGTTTAAPFGGTTTAAPSPTSISPTASDSATSQEPVSSAPATAN